MGEHSFARRLALRRNVTARSKQTDHDRGMGHRRIPSCRQQGRLDQAGLDDFRTRYPRLKAAVYWHERWQNLDQSYSNLHINSSVESLNAYREGIANPYWLGNLILRVIKN